MSERSWTSAIFKEPVEGPIRLGTLHLAGDGQADPRVHGGPEKAVLAYSADHYPLWNADLAPLRLPYGAFGENFTIAGQTEASVCIGDTYSVGEARVQVAQPRTPCWKLARKWDLKDLPARVLDTGRTGWYFRVLQEGEVRRGMAIDLLERPLPQWTVARVGRLAAGGAGAQEAADLAACPLLSPGWRRAFEEMRASS